MEDAMQVNKPITRARMKSPIKPAITGPRALRDPRSREYAIQTMQSLKRFLESKTFDAKHVADELGRIEQYKHWEVLGFKDLDAYVRAEVGITLKKLKARLAQDLAADSSVPPLAQPGEIGRGRNRVDDVNSNGGGNSASYIVRRLKRDHPGIAEALARGEYASARAAGIAAGFIKRRSPLEKILKLLPQLNFQDCKTLLARLQAVLRAFWE
jgi:hypothetical protein